MSITAPALQYLLPVKSENRWNDMLATFIGTDPGPISALLGISGAVEVRREVSLAGIGSRRDRLDLLLTRPGDFAPLAVIETKVLSTVGPDQLERYLAAFPGAHTYRLLHLRSFPVGSATEPPWTPLLWEEVIAAYATSEHPWIAATATAWLEHLGAFVPRISAKTRWNDVRDTPAEMELDLRARMVWLAGQMSDWCSIEHELTPTVAGGTWVARMGIPLNIPGYRLALEVGEGLTSQSWAPHPSRTYSERLQGPHAWIGLELEADTSEHFDWDLLFTLFRQHVVGPDGRTHDGRNWTKTRPGLRDPGDRARWEAARERHGLPPWIGQGYGMRQAVNYGNCMFGARFRLPPTLTMREVESALRDAEYLLIAMSADLVGER